MDNVVTSIELKIPKIINIKFEDHKNKYLALFTGGSEGSTPIVVKVKPGKDHIVTESLENPFMSFMKIDNADNVDSGNADGILPIFTINPIQLGKGPYDEVTKRCPTQLTLDAYVGDPDPVTVTVEIEDEIGSGHKS